MKLRLASVVILGLALLAPPASAEPIVDEELHFTLELPANFTALAKGTALRRYSHPSGLKASLSRIDNPNLPAYWRKESKAFLASLERGVAKASTGYRLRTRQDSRAGRTPVLDIHFQRVREGVRELVWMRFLLFRRFALVASVSSPYRADRKTRKLAEKFTSSLAPYVAAEPTTP